MAYTWSTKSTATLRVKDASSNAFHTYSGINPNVATPDEAVTQLNKLLNIGGQEATADENAKLTSTKEATQNA